MPFSIRSFHELNLNENLQLIYTPTGKGVIVFVTPQVV